MENILGLINPMAVVVVVSYIIGSTDIYEHAVNGELSRRDKILIVLIFGLFSIYGTIFGIEIADTRANIRDLGPMVAGIIAGPVVGAAAGLIGAIHRFFLGGITQIPCTIAAVLAGLAGGLLCKIYKDKFVPLVVAGAVMAFFEAFHMVFVLWISDLQGHYYEALEIVKAASIPMIFANAVGVVLTLYFTRNILKERKTRSEKDIFENELKIGRNIQKSLLPMIFPPFPDRKEFELYADNVPAKEVAGDFYDFFFIEEDRLALIIADVSGKGVSAGLFMAITRTLLKIVSEDIKEPSKILTKSNRILSADNDACMFITMFLGIYDVNTGNMEFANAGHNPPLILSKNGTVTELAVTHDPVLGVVEDVVYDHGEVNIEANQTLVLYTDGITEAQSPKGEFYGDDRFWNFLKRNKDKGLEDVVKNLKIELDTFQGGQQFDDITFLFMHRN